MDPFFLDVRTTSMLILSDLEKGELNWEDERVQYFLPVGLFFADFDLLRVVAENILVEEDNEIVQNFLSKVESICEVNENNLHKSVSELFEPVEPVERDL